MASSLFSLRAWQSSRTTSFQVLFGYPLMLEIYQKCPGYPTTDPLQKLPPIPLITLSVNILKENQLGRKHDLLHSAHENKPVLRIAKTASHVTQHCSQMKTRWSYGLFLCDFLALNFYLCCHWQQSENIFEVQLVESTGTSTSRWQSGWRMPPAGKHMFTTPVRFTCCERTLTELLVYYCFIRTYACTDGPTTHNHNA